MGTVAAALALLEIIERLAALYAKGKADLEQSGELTDEQRQQLNDREKAAFATPAWQPESP